MEQKKFEMDIIILIGCVIFTAGLFVGGFIAPPPGDISASVLKAGGIMLSFATLAIARQTIRDGRVAKFTKGDMQITVGSDKGKDNCCKIDEEQEFDS